MTTTSQNDYIPIFAQILLAIKLCPLTFDSKLPGLNAVTNNLNVSFQFHFTLGFLSFRANCVNEFKQKRPDMQMNKRFIKNMKVPTWIQIRDFRPKVIYACLKIKD